MNLTEIIDTDFFKNHAGRAYGLPHAHQMIEDAIARGASTFTTENCFFICWPSSEPRVGEWHSFNAGTGKDLTRGVNALMWLLRGQYDRAVTYYDNARINDLVRYLDFPGTVDRIDAGVDKTFRLTVDLKEL